MLQHFYNLSDEQAEFQIRDRHSFCRFLGLSPEGRALSAREKEANRKRSKVRARVEQVFAQQSNRLVRTIGKARAEVKIGLMNMVCNMRRLAWLAG